MAGVSRRFGVDEALSRIFDTGEDSDDDLDDGAANFLTDHDDLVDSEWEYSDNDDSDYENDLIAGRPTRAHMQVLPAKGG